MDKRILKKLGNRYGGFLAMDKGTTLKMDLMWARILVKMEGKEKPSSVNILVGVRSNEFFFSSVKSKYYIDSKRIQMYTGCEQKGTKTKNKPKHPTTPQTM